MDTINDSLKDEKKEEKITIFRQDIKVEKIIKVKELNLDAKAKEVIKNLAEKNNVKEEVIEEAIRELLKESISDDSYILSYSFPTSLIEKKINEKGK